MKSELFCVFSLSLWDYGGVRDAVLCHFIPPGVQVCTLCLIIWMLSQQCTLLNLTSWWLAVDDVLKILFYLLLFIFVHRYWFDFLLTRYLFSSSSLFTRRKNVGIVIGLICITDIIDCIFIYIYIYICGLIFYTLLRIFLSIFVHTYM